MTEAVCPCCGAVVEPSRLLVDLNSNCVTRLGRTVPLQPRETEIILALNRVYPRRASVNKLISAVWGRGDEPDAALVSIRVRICTLRAKIAPLGLSIPRSRVAGYALVLHDEAVTPGPNFHRWAA